MKFLRIAFAAVAALGFGSAYAFHSGGVAECGGCHSMHTSTDQTYLLIADTASDTCLSCHGKPDTAPSSYHVMTAGMNPTTGVPVERGPGGDFAWLLKTWTYSSHGESGASTGQSHGHNIIAPGFGITVDTDFATAPGGTFNSNTLGCNSCHDPHGKMRRIASGTASGDTAYSWVTSGAPITASGSYNSSPVPTATAAVGAYRLLRGRVADDPVQSQVSVTFAGNFLAIAPKTYNQSEATNMVRVAYGADGLNANGGATDTVGQWCGSCHPDMHSALNSKLVHPIDHSLDAYATNYNNYVSSGVMNVANASSSYLSLVPFAEKTGDFGTLKSHASNTNAYMNGPAAVDQVMCLSCHRAHASAFPDMLRWNYEGGEFLTTADSTGAILWAASLGMNQAETNAGYQDISATKFGNYQRQLCNKCHAKD